MSERDYEGCESFVESMALVGMSMIGLGVYGDDFSMRLFGGALLLPVVVKYSVKVGDAVYDFCGGLVDLLRR